MPGFHLPQNIWHALHSVPCWQKALTRIEGEFRISCVVGLFLGSLFSIASQMVRRSREYRDGSFGA